MEVETASDKDKRIKELENELAAEKARSQYLEEKVQELKNRIIELNRKAEEEEEAITMKLMRRLNELQTEKEEIQQQASAEESQITNKFLKRLDELQKEKVQLEQKLEYEQENMVNRLQRQIQAIHREKAELRSRLRDDTHVLLKTIRDTIDLLQQARSASATPALGPAPVDLREEMEEVNRRMETFSLTPSAVPSTSTFSAEPLSPLSPSLMAQRKVMEGERKMKGMIPLLNGMDRTLSSPSDPYELTTSQQMQLGGVILDDASTRLRTGSISSSRSRSNSIIARERSRHTSISE